MPAMTGAGRGAGTGLPVGAPAALGAGVGGAGTGVRAAAGADATEGAAAAAAADGAGAGILIVGAAVGFGGKLIRTVSFLGCTLAASVGRGGTAPDGVFGTFSAINFFESKLELVPVGVKWLLTANWRLPMTTGRRTPARGNNVLKNSISSAHDDRHRGHRGNHRRHHHHHHHRNEAAVLREAARC